MINFHKQAPVYTKVNGELTFKQYVEGSCNSADVSNLPTDVAGGSNVLVVDTGAVKVFNEATGSWGDL